MIKYIYFLILLMPFSFAQAVIIKVSAEYIQSLSKPGENEFRITDPCTPLPLAVSCADDTSRFMTIDSDIDKPLVKNSSLIERFFYHSFPSEKIIQLSSENGIPASIKFSMTHTGYTIENKIFNINNNDVQADVSAKCKLVDYELSYIGDQADTLLYEIDIGAQKTGGACYSRDFSNWPVSSYPYISRIKKFYLGYKLAPVNIDSISNGVYRGRLNLTVGQARDIYFTNLSYRFPTVIELEVLLVVRNHLKVIFPSVGNKVVLQPDRGWHHGDKTPSLSGVMPVQITSSIPYWIKLECQYLSTIDDSCQIKSDKNASLVSMSIYKKSTNGNVLLSPTLKKTFEKNEPISNGLFSFKINQDKVKNMMNYPGSTYKGNVTIIMDAMIEPIL